MASPGTSLPAMPPLALLATWIESSQPPWEQALKAMVILAGILGPCVGFPEWLDYRQQKRRRPPNE